MAIDKELFYMSNGIKVKCSADGGLYPTVEARRYTEKEVIAILEDIEKTMKNKRDNFFTSHKLIERGYEFAVSDLGYIIRDKIKEVRNDKG